MIKFQTNAADIVKDLLGLGKATPRNIEKVAKQWAPEVVESARKLAPKDTGRLEQGITSVVKRKSRATLVSFGWDKKAFYGAFVEFGTKGRGARPHLRPAIAKRLPQLQANLAAITARTWEK